MFQSCELVGCRKRFLIEPIGLPVGFLASFLLFGF